MREKQSIEESSFQTLEALCTHLAHRIIVYFLLPHYPLPQEDHHNSHHQHQHPSHASWNYQRIRICLSKPTAVTFADAPSVSILLDSDPSKSQDVKELWRQREKLVGVGLGGRQEAMVPFPLEGRLDEWIASNEVRWSGE